VAMLTMTLAFTLRLHLHSHFTAHSSHLGAARAPGGTRSHTPHPLTRPTRCGRASHSRSACCLCAPRRYPLRGRASACSCQCPPRAHGRRASAPLQPIHPLATSLPPPCSPSLAPPLTTPPLPPPPPSPLQASLEAAHLFIRLIDRDRYSRDDTMGSGVLSCAGLLHSASGEPVSGGVPFELPLTCCGVKAGTLYGRLHAQRKENSIRDNLRRGHYFKHLFTSSGPLLAARRSARTSRSESDSVSEEDSSSRRSLRAFAARAAATKAPIARSATGLDPPSASGRAGAAKLERRRSSL
jgi:hypothetical protein